MKAAEITINAASLVSGDRAQTHGDMHVHFAHVASLWTAYLRGRSELTAADIGKMMALLKIARSESGNVNVDDFIDGVGYIACAGEIALKEFKR